MSTKSFWKVLLTFAAIFLLGAVTGAALMRTAQRTTHAKSDVERDWAQREGQTLRKRLQLRPEQITQLEPVLAQTAGEMRQVKLETARRIAELIKQNSGQVMKLLDDEQKEEFEALIKERQQQMGKTLAGPKIKK